MGNMGMAEMERQENIDRMLREDAEAGHKPGCNISNPGGLCTCGLYSYPVPILRIDNEAEKDGFKVNTPETWKAIIYIAIGLLLAYALQAAGVLY